VATLEICPNCGEPVWVVIPLPTPGDADEAPLGAIGGAGGVLVGRALYQAARDEHGAYMCVTQDGQVFRGHMVSGFEDLPDRICASVGVYRVGDLHSAVCPARSKGVR